MLNSALPSKTMIQLVTRDIIAVLAKRKRARALGTKLPLTYEFTRFLKLPQSHSIESLWQYFVHLLPRIDVSRQQIFHMNVRLRMYTYSFSNMDAIDAQGLLQCFELITNMFT